MKWAFWAVSSKKSQIVSINAKIMPSKKYIFGLGLFGKKIRSERLTSAIEIDRAKSGIEAH